MTGSPSMARYCLRAIDCPTSSSKAYSPSPGRSISPEKVWKKRRSRRLPDVPVAFTVTDSPAKALANFPMLVKIDPVRIPEIYRQAAPDASDIRFTSPYDATIQYPFEIDTWNPDGESLIWVRMPEYAAGARVVMNWGRIAAEDEEGHVAYDDFGQIIPAELPAVSDESVWSEYAGVWHMADASDSSANNTPGTLGSVASATDGVFGDALGASSQGSPLLTATKNPALDALTNSAFTVSFWVYYNSENTHLPFLFS